MPRKVFTLTFNFCFKILFKANLNQLFKVKYPKSKIKMEEAFKCTYKTKLYEVIYHSVIEAEREILKGLSLVKSRYLHNIMTFTALSLPILTLL